VRIDNQMDKNTGKILRETIGDLLIAMLLSGRPAA
jgi:hypothetical protein